MKIFKGLGSGRLVANGLGHVGGHDGGIEENPVGDPGGCSVNPPDVLGVRFPLCGVKGVGIRIDADDVMTIGSGGPGESSSAASQIKNLAAGEFVDDGQEERVVHRPQVLCVVEGGELFSGQG